jgi:hypothetical protein
MKVLEANFDGFKIDVPAELKGRGPCKVGIVIDDLAGLIDTSVKKGNWSVWDVVNRPGSRLTDEQMRAREAELRKDRDEWDDD